MARLPAALGIAFLLAFARADEPGRGAELQGDWQLLETADARRTDPGDASIRMTFQGQEVHMAFLGLRTNQGTFEVGSAGKLQAIDFRFQDGKVLRGVFARTGDVLVLCVDFAGNARPQSLTPAGTQWRETWKLARK